MRKWIALLALAGCATPAAKSPTTTPTTAAPAQVQVVLSPAAKALSPPALAAWMVYATTQTLVRTAQKGAADLFTEELMGREQLARLWSEEGDGREPALDAMVAVEKAGFMDEYVVAFLMRPGWFVSPKVAAALELEKFADWAAAHLRDHEPAKLAGIVSDPEPRKQVAPGHGIDDGIALRSKEQCGGLVDELKARVARWEAIKPSLGNRLALASRAGGVTLIRLLAMPSVRAQIRERGFVLVSPSVKQVFAMQAFCAIETLDLVAAERALRLGLALDPSDEHAAGELAQVLGMQKRWDESLAQTEVAVGLSGDPCRQAVNWRRRGYVFIHKHQLDEARRAYLKSLELDPGNPIALNELALIDRALKASGAGPGGALPTSLIVRTVCKD